MSDLNTIAKVDYKRWTVEQYHRLAEVNLIDASEKIELIDGKLIYTAPIGRHHIAYVNKIEEWLKEQLGKQAIVQVQNPIVLNKYSEPEPDISVLRRTENFYFDQSPDPEDIYLVIEISDTTLEKDRTIKMEQYAKSGIAEYWIINIQGEQMEIHLSPQEDGYGSIQHLKKGQKFKSLLLGEILVSDILF